VKSHAEEITHPSCSAAGAADVMSILEIRIQLNPRIDIVTIGIV
jgi:hypothetical protein